ncbi:MAG: hypothetical protein IPK91_15670 [Saprospiraceae bacterium]|nr:hypothetical protein [Saprospiraceae bacterium]MBK8298683.1 hypothetical protein [Saprospiraceae bacterium]
MKTIIDKPTNINKVILTKLVDLIDEGDQVDRKFIERGLSKADLIAIYLHDDKIITAATLKNPLPSYRDSVFISAGVESQRKLFIKELGYVVTHPEYRGQNLCQK